MLACKIQLFAIEILSPSASKVMISNELNVSLLLKRKRCPVSHFQFLILPSDKTPNYPPMLLISQKKFLLSPASPHSHTTTFVVTHARRRHLHRSSPILLTAFLLSPTRPPCRARIWRDNAGSKLGHPDRSRSIGSGGTHGCRDLSRKARIRRRCLICRGSDPILPSRGVREYGRED
jgi:hypothetical protein